MTTTTPDAAAGLNMTALQSSLRTLGDEVLKLTRIGVELPELVRTSPTYVDDILVVLERESTAVTAAIAHALDVTYPAQLAAEVDRLRSELAKVEARHREAIADAAARAGSLSGAEREKEPSRREQRRDLERRLSVAYAAVDNVRDGIPR